MKNSVLKIPVFFFLSCLICVAIGCSKKNDLTLEETQAAEEVRAIQEKRLADSNALELVKKISYVKDPRTDNVCYGVYWRAEDVGRPFAWAAATASVVPCNEVEHLLVNQGASR